MCEALLSYRQGSTQLYNNVVAGVFYYCEFSNRIVCIVGPNYNN